MGTSAAWFLAEREHEVLLIHDPKDAGAHEDWSRLARLSFDGPEDEMECSKHPIELLDLIEEVRSMNTGAPVCQWHQGCSSWPAQKLPWRKHANEGKLMVCRDTDARPLMNWTNFTLGTQ